MNNARRKKLDTIRVKLEDLAQELETIKGEEQDYFDAIPEALQSSPQSELSANALSELETASEYVSDALTAIEGAAQ